MARGIKKTDPGAVDDNAVKRAMNRRKSMEDQLKALDPEPQNPIDAAAEELEYGNQSEYEKEVFGD